MQPSSGVFRVQDIPGPDPHAMAEAIRRQLGRPCVVMALFPAESDLTSPATAFRVDGEGSTVANRLGPWLRSFSEVRVVPVPSYLRQDLRAFRVLVVPIWTPVWHLGAVAVPQPVETRKDLDVVASMVFDFALDMERADRARAVLDFAARR